MSLLRPRRTLPRPTPAVDPAEVEDVFAGGKSREVPPAGATVIDAANDDTGADPAADVVPPLYSGLSRLNNWGETARSGMTVDLALRDVGPLAVHPFKGLSRLPVGTALIWDVMPSIHARIGSTTSPWTSVRRK